VLEQLHHELSVSCLPGDLPEFIEVNIEKLDIGDNITVADLELPENVKAELPEDTVLFHVAVPATEEEEETDEEAETGSEEAALVGEEDEE
jgi:large subunit ribosomal protein L25